jgi:uncharacterized repeat protein (TIGR01451 family)
LYYTTELAPGETSTIIYRVLFTNINGGTGWIVPDYFDVYDDTSGHFYGTDRNYAWVAGFSIAGSEKVSNPEEVAPGGTFSYLITLANPSAEDREVLLTDPLPEEVEFVSASPGMTYDAGTHTVSWSGWLSGTSLSTLDFEIAVEVLPDVEEGTIIENEAGLFRKFDAFPIAFLSTETLVDDGLDPTLTVSKSVDDLVVGAEGSLEYTIVVTNEGTEAAIGATVYDEIPAELVIDEASILGGAVYADGVLTWTGDLAAGASLTITFEATVSVDAHSGLALINAAQAWAENHPSVVYNSAVTEVIFVKLFIPLISQ